MNTTTKDFHVGDILSITTDRLLSPNGIGGVYQILNFMAGDELFTHQLSRAGRICKPELLLQHPQLDTPEFQIEIGTLLEMLESESGKREPRMLINGWLGRIAEKYGETLPVKPLDTDDWTSINPVDELIDMVGKDKVIVAEM